MITDNVLQCIARLESIDPKDEFAYEEAFLAFMTVKKLPVFVFNISEGLEVFRTRTSFEDALFNHPDEISLAPHKAISSFARCNRPYQSKFYCGDKRATSYIELAEYWADNKDVGEKLYVTIGRWLVKRPFSAIIITSPDPEQRLSEFDKYHGKGLDLILAEYEGEFKEANILIYRYLFEKFRKPAKKDLHTYIVTTAYCNIAFARERGNIDAIYYPSVPFGGAGVNFAFNHKFVTLQNMELIGALRDELTVYINQANKKSFHQTGNIEAKSVTPVSIEW